MARNKDKPDIPPGTPFQRIRPMLITFFVVAVIGPLLFSSYWLNTFSTVACLTLVAGTVSMTWPAALVMRNPAVPPLLS